MIHAMIDFETLSTMPNAVVLSLGAVTFNDAAVIDTFYVNVDREDCKALGLHVQQSAVDWWAKQSDAAKQSLLMPPPMPLLEAMTAFSKWWRATGAQCIWGNGADFDNPIMRSLFNALDADTPYRPYVGRCYRTIKSIPGMPIMTVRQGVHHNALDDAKNQAEHLIAMNKVIKVFK